MVGFDNQELLAAHSRPPLTTIRIPYFEMGSWAVDQLTDAEPNEDRSALEPVTLDCPLVSRASVDRPPVEGRKQRLRSATKSRAISNDNAWPTSAMDFDWRKRTGFAIPRHHLLSPRRRCSKFCCLFLGNGNRISQQRFMREDLAQYDELQPALVQLVEEARSDLEDETRATAVLIAVRGQLVALDQMGSDGFIVQGDVCQPEDISRMFRGQK